MEQQIRQLSQPWSAGDVILRVAVIAAIWLVLTEGKLSYWGLAIIAVLGSAFASLLLAPKFRLRWSLSGWWRFIPYFIRESVVGGLDVAFRALTIRPRVDPVFMEFHFRIAEEPARVMVANIMSLMPGALSVSIDDDCLRLHVLDRSMSALESAREVEEHVARMFRLELEGE